MQNTVTAFAHKYGLTGQEVMTVIENVFSTRLTQWHGREVMVFFREDLCLEAVAYGSTDGIMSQQIFDFSKLRGVKTIMRDIESSLVKTSVLKQIALYKSYEKELRWGEITGMGHEGQYQVEMEIIPGERIMATCPLNRIGVHERNTAKSLIGKKRAFHVRRVEPVSLGGTARIKVKVDRVSKTLVEILVKEQLGYLAEKMTIRCTKRYVGQKSFVVTSRRIPKSAIVAVTRELNERMQVKFDRNL